MSRVGGTTRRTGKTRVGGRAADVVDRVVSATLTELSRVGYEAMRVEDIATLSGVNKTTIYRRWPSKAELLTSALRQVAKAHMAPIDTGTLRGDLKASLLAAFNLSPFEQGILRVIQMERSLKAIDAFAQRMRDDMREVRIAMVKRGISRGELPTGVDAALVVELVSAPVQRALLFNETVDSASVERMLEIVLIGAAAAAATAKKPKRATSPRRRVTNRSAAAKS